MRLVINARSGLARHAPAIDRAVEFLSGRDIEVHSEMVASSDALLRAASAASASDADVVVAGGGDGTISAVAAGLVHTNKALGILPLGTFNFFAKRFGIPPDLDDALAVIAGGHITPVSVGEVNGHIFLNNSSIGLYPALLRHRERFYNRIGRSRLVAYSSAALALARRPPTLRLQLDVDAAGVERDAALLFAAANPAQLAEFGLDARSCLEKGRLALFIAPSMAWPKLWSMALGGWLRGFAEAAELETLCARELVVSLKRTRVRIAIDGEIVRVRPPVRYRLHADGLRVVVPRGR